MNSRPKGGQQGEKEFCCVLCEESVRTRFLVNNKQTNRMDLLLSACYGEDREGVSSSSSSSPSIQDQYRGFISEDRKLEQVIWRWRLS